MRLNRLSEAFKNLTGALLSGYCPRDCDYSTSLMDSLPIIICSGKRVPSVAKEITDKGYCSTKSMYYYGLKLHALAFHRPDHLPFPESKIRVCVAPFGAQNHWCDFNPRLTPGVINIQSPT